MSNLLETPIAYLKGVGPQKALLLQKELEIFFYKDLLSFFPFRYIDRSKFYKISEIKDTNTDIQIIGKVLGIKEIPQKRGKRLSVKLADDTGIIELIWFKGIEWYKKNIQLHQTYVVFGKPTNFLGNFSITHPDFETLIDHQKKTTQGLQGIYHSTEKLSKRYINSKFFNKILLNLFNQIQGPLQETIPPYLVSHLNLLDRTKAFFQIHYPKDTNALQIALFRFKFEELFYIQLHLISKKITQKTKFKGYRFKKIGEKFNTFYNDHLSFELTGAQKKVLKEIRLDVNREAQMNRLIQGDVGSGKTIVALLSMLIGIDNGFQACMMAPTEILALQHFTEIHKMLQNINLNVELLTGSTTTKKRKEIHQDLQNGHIHILIGTHALLEDVVQFQNLGIAIIDEQHRFGVEQRSKMWRKNTLPPHILVMTATPIPRTLAMSLYGDLDISVIDELPPHRKPVQTLHKYEKDRLTVFHFIKKEIEKGRQVYIVYPLIEESEALDYHNLMEGYKSIERYFPKPQYQISIVHGQMKAADKELDMNRFAKGETQIMVATTAIEVGVNVPNASVMVIENSEKFGLSQLHQLRGRVGRGAEQSFCILMSSHKLSKDAKTRLETMVYTNDGFEVADVDLKLRGPGNLEGTQQSGALNLKIANLTQDTDILSLARSSAIEILQEDPHLELEKNAILKKIYQNTQDKNIWGNIS